MGPDTLTHVALAVGGSLITLLFTAGGFYIYVRMSISHLEEWGRENHKLLDQKIDKNFETLDGKINTNQKDIMDDIKGIGIKVSFSDRQRMRQYHNMSTAVMLVSPPTKESEVSYLLKEETAS